MPDRTTMNGKPVLEIPSKTVINFKSGFEHKLLCDGPTFTTGDACAYSCAFCYVPSVMNQRLFMLKQAGVIPPGTVHMDTVLRRKGALATLKQQLDAKFWKGKKRREDVWEREYGKVIYGSPLVDVAANLELADETIEACKLILELSPWDIRLLSKSTFLTRIALALGTAGKSRVIYGVSTGTFDDKLASAFEEGCPKVSKRLESLRGLSEAGCRTFGMICPSLPQRDYTAFAAEAHAKLNAFVTEHVWAEVLNVRGDSMTLTCKALEAAGYKFEADELKAVSLDKREWELYARDTFSAHSVRWGAFNGGPTLRFLQYVNEQSLPWWNSYVPFGAVLL